MRLVGQTVQAVVLAAVGIGVQQLVTAGIYGILAYPYGSSLRVSWMDYVHEYLLWRIRMPGHAMTRMQVIANALALVIVVVGALVLYEGVYA